MTTLRSPPRLDLSGFEKRALSEMSGVWLPMAAAPGWLRHISQANPLSYVIDAVRKLFVGDLSSTTVVKGSQIALAVTVLR